MRALIGIALVILPLLGHGSAQAGSVAAGSITGKVFTEGTHRELAVLPSVLIVIHEPVSYAALAVAVSTDASSTGPVEMNMATVSSTTSTQLMRLRAMDCAFSRKVNHHA